MWKHNLYKISKICVYVMVELGRVWPPASLSSLQTLTSTSCKGTHNNTQKSQDGLKTFFLKGQVSFPMPGEESGQEYSATGLMTMILFFPQPNENIRNPGKIKMLNTSVVTVYRDITTEQRSVSLFHFKFLRSLKLFWLS